MAKQAGIFPLRGSVGEATFTGGEFGFQVRIKSSLDADKVKTDPRFAGSRDASAEFGRAASGSGSLRRAVRNTGILTKDARTHPRLSKLMGEVLRKDTKGDRGKRIIRPENLPLLDGFEWHRDYAVSNTLYATVQQSTNQSGKLVVSLPAFSPEDMLLWPKGATHAEIRAVQVEGDFRQRNLFASSARSGLLPKNGAATDIVLELDTVTQFTVMGIGILFHRVINGFEQPLTGGDCFCIKKLVSGVAVAPDEYVEDTSIEALAVAADTHQNTMPPEDTNANTQAPAQMAALHWNAGRWEARVPAIEPLELLEDETSRPRWMGTQPPMEAYAALAFQCGNAFTALSPQTQSATPGAG